MGNHKSIEAFAEACRYMPGGVNSPVRAFGGVDRQPLFIAGAKGSRIFDIDGNEYIDYVGSWGPMILGHAHPAVVAAIHKAADRGTSFGAPTLAETELAARIVRAFGSIEKLRLLCSGTEAVMTAIRLARAYTGRDTIVKMAGCYHGHSDSLLVVAGSGLAEGGTAASPGVPEALAGLTVVVPYNDLEALRAGLPEAAGQIAAVLVEPVAANMGVVPPEPGYLEGASPPLRRERHAADLRRGHQRLPRGLRRSPGTLRRPGRPDLPGQDRRRGAASGRLRRTGRDHGPAGPAGPRLPGRHPERQSAGDRRGQSPRWRSWRKARADGTNEAMRAQLAAADLEVGLAQAAAEAGVPVTINRVGSLLSCFFTDKPVRNFDDVRATNIAAFKKFFAEMLDRGIYLAPSAYEAMFVSLAHTKQDIERTVEAARESFRAVAMA